MNILEVTKNNTIIGYRIEEKHQTIDWLLSKMCENMKNWLEQNKGGVYELPTKVEEDNIQGDYKVMHQDQKLLVDFYNKNRLRVHKDTVYTQNGGAVFVYKEETETAVCDILCITKKGYQIAHDLGALDEADIGNTPNFLYTKVTQDNLRHLSRRFTRGHMDNQPITLYTHQEGAPQEGVFVYECEVLEDLIDNKLVKYIELG